MDIKDLDLDNIIENTEKTFLKKRENGLILSDKQIEILNKYQINYQACTSLKELIFLIEQTIDDEYDDLEDLSRDLAEFDYYNYTNK